MSLPKINTNQYYIYILIVIMGFFSKTVRAELEVGKPAPAFELNDQYMKIHNLEKYAGKWLVLYFYPKDDTPGCTIEACNFRDDIIQIRSLDAEILGVSLDSSESHASFAEDHGLPFPLLSDTGGEVAKSYGSLMSMGPIKFARRHTIIIDKKGNIAKIYRRVDPKIHSGQIIADLKELQSK